MVDFPSDEAIESDADPRPVLAQFIAAVRDFLGEFVEAGVDPNGKPLFEENLHDLMRSAFQETRQHFEALGQRTTELSDGSIAEHALFGNSLRFKFSVVRHRIAQFRERGGAGLFRWVLDTIEGVLDSIIDAAGTGGAVKELKEAIRNSTQA